MSLGRPRHRWEDNIKMDLKETGCDDVDWFHMAQHMVQWWNIVYTVINTWVS
jgi:hypothetical protein